ncbi:MAG: DUF3187 family protein [Verrucomicrobiota bacterium]|nr:DUF3187 family protein [Verrucomicrobiota bacterium]
MRFNLGGKRILGAASILLAAMLVAEGSEFNPPTVLLGPTELQDTFLPSQLRYQSYPESAEVIAPGQWLANVTVDWTAHLAQTDTYLFDGESVTSTLKVRHSPMKRLELGVDIPYTVRVNGTADRFIEFVETTLDAKVDARFALPRDTYQATLASPDGTGMVLKKGSDLSDITLRLKYQLAGREEACVDLAAVATLSLPTGGSTFGGDGISPGLGLHVQKPVGKWNFFLGLAGNYYSDDLEQNFEFNDFRGMTYAGLSWRLFKRVAAVGEYQIYSPFAPRNSPLDEIAHYYSITGRFFITEKITFEAGIVENVGTIENRNSSDVTFKFALAGLF